MVHKFIFLILGLSSAVAAADILFLDMNNGANEVLAAQRAAAKRGEKLIVWPGDGAVRSQVEQKISALSKQFAAVSQACGRAGATTCPASKAIDNQMASLRNSIPNFDSEKLKSSLAKLEAAGTKVSSIVISGHDGNGRFSGTSGGTTSAELNEALNVAPNLRAGVHSIALWGCYTATMGQVEGNWKAIFPSAKMVAGYEGKAPLSTRKASATYLEELLVQEDHLVKQTDLASLNQAFRKLGDVGVTHGALCVNQDMYVSMDSKPASIKAALGACAPTPADAKATDQMNCYLNAEAACPDVPLSTDTSALRTLYNHLQSTSHCDAKLADLQIRRPSRDVLIRLIFDKMVRANFERWGREGLADLDKALKELGAPADLRFSGLDKLGRKEFVDRVQKLADFYQQLDRQRADDKIRDRVSDVGSYLAGLRDVSKLDARSIPFGWVEPNATDKPEGWDLKRFNSIQYNSQVRVVSAEYSKADEVIRNMKVTTPQITALRQQSEAASARLSQMEETTPQQVAAYKSASRAIEKLDDQIYRLEWTPERRALGQKRIEFYNAEVTRMKSTKTPEAFIEAAVAARDEWTDYLSDIDKGTSD